jgi:hypothetical protein
MILVCEMRFAPENRDAAATFRKCSDDFSAKALICLHLTLDSAQVGLTPHPDIQQFFTCETARARGWDLL